MTTLAKAKRMGRRAKLIFAEHRNPATIRRLLRAEFPDATPQEIDRARVRGTALYDLDRLISAGFPPLTINLPYPLPPSSTPVNPEPDIIRISGKARIVTNGIESFKSWSADVENGRPYAAWLARIEATFNFWLLGIGFGPAVDTVEVADPCTAVY